MLDYNNQTTLDNRKKIMITNHWGIYVDSEKPIGGVIQNNNVEWLDDECYNSKTIDLDWIEFLKSKPTEEEKEMYESDNPTILIGDWIKRNGKYQPKKSGEYAAIVGESETQVVFSKFTKRCALCSPCYPGQGDLDSEGEYLTYNLPEDLIGFKEG
jgi:hypothetical protein